MPSCWPPAAWPSLPCSTSCSDPGRRIRPTAKASAAPCGGRLFCVRGPGRCRGASCHRPAHSGKTPPPASQDDAHDEGSEEDEAEGQPAKGHRACPLWRPVRRHGIGAQDGGACGRKGPPPSRRPAAQAAGPGHRRGPVPRGHTLPPDGQEGGPAGAAAGIRTTRKAGGLLWPYKGLLPAAPKDAGFHVVQAQCPCRLDYPLKGS